MEYKRYLEAGAVASTHGVRGAVMIQPWSDGPEFLCDFERVFIDGTEMKIESASVHKSMVLCKLAGVDDMNTASALRGKTVFIDREDVTLEEGRHFVQDLIGLDVVDVKLGNIGKLAEVINLPSNDVYVVQGRQRYMIPVVPDFVKKVDLEAARVEVAIIEGMAL